MSNPFLDLAGQMVAAGSLRERFFWAEVVSVNPLRVREDTAQTPLNIEPVALCTPVQGARVFCLRYGRRLIVLGMKGGTIPSVEPDPEPKKVVFELENVSPYLAWSRGVVKDGRVILSLGWRGGFSVNAWGALDLGRVPTQFQPSHQVGLMIPGYANYTGHLWALGVNHQSRQVYIGSAVTNTFPAGSYNGTLVYDID